MSCSCILQAILLPFSRFGAIIALITAVSVVYSLTVCVAALATFAPARFVNGLRSTAVAVLAMAAVVGGGVFILFAMARFGGMHIPGPNGSDLFSVGQ